MTSNEEYDYEPEPIHNGSSGNSTINDILQTLVSAPCRDAACVSAILLNALIFLLGTIGNGMVVWIAGFKMKKSINTTWYLSLAVSDLIFCFTLPLMMVRIAVDDWPFGLFMCKFTSFAMFLNMYSSIFVLVIISVDRCLTVKFPVWAQNNRSVSKASVVVLLAWLISALFSVPPVKFRHIYNHSPTFRVCYNNYDGHHQTAVFVRFTVGFLIPFLSICFCYSILVLKLRTNQISKSNKPYKIMTLLIVTFLLCWLPFHIATILELKASQNNWKLHTAIQITGTLASANSFLNPFLYAFMAKDMKRKCVSFLSKIESGMGPEESRSAFRGTSITNSGEHRASTAL